jgi:hypothetical protein
MINETWTIVVSVLELNFDFVNCVERVNKYYYYYVGMEENCSKFQKQ